jgi:hypothetical protein
MRGCYPERVSAAFRASAISPVLLHRERDPAELRDDLDQFFERMHLDGVHDRGEDEFGAAVGRRIPGEGLAGEEDRIAGRVVHPAGTRLRLDLAL